MERITTEGFEKSIIKSCSGWDGELEMIQFYDPELAVDIEGVGKAGEIVGTIGFLMVIGEVCFYTKDGREEIFRREFKPSLEK